MWICRANIQKAGKFHAKGMMKENTQEIQWGWGLIKNFKFLKFVKFKFQATGLISGY